MKKQLILSISLALGLLNTALSMKNVIFDLGGVILEGSVKTFVDSMRQEDLTCDMALYDVVKNKFWEHWDNGLITSDELIIELAKQHNKDHLIKLFSLMTSPVRPFSKECTTCIQKLKKQGYAVYLLSNLSKDMYAKVMVMNPSLFALFTGMLFSSEINISKPDLRIYQSLLNSYELTAEESIFIDDSLKNVQAAQELKITGVLYEPGKLEEALAQKGILLH